MPSYRVERAVSGRASCQDTDCKKHGIKIPQDDLRFGTWVEIQEHGSWRWKHWGCISGKQLSSLRASLDPDETGNYDWSFLDGYDSEDRGSLDAYPDLQEKVRRVVTQGFIDPEDFNGDAEMNKLGSAGIRTAATKKKMAEDDKNQTHEIEELKARVAAAEAERGASKKGAKKKPASKKRAKEEESDEEEVFEESKPASKKRATKTKVKKEEMNADIMPTTNSKPKSKGGRKNAVKEEDIDEQNGHGDALEIKPQPSTRKGREKAVKGEDFKEENGFVDASEVDVKLKSAKRKGRKNAVKKEELEASSSLSGITPSVVKDEDAQATEDDIKKEIAAEEEAEVEDSQPKRKGDKAKKAKTATPKPSSTRASRRRISSKNEGQ